MEINKILKRLFLSLTLILSLSSVSAQRGLSFFSSELENGVKKQLKLGENDVITSDIADTITVLDLSRNGIADIRDIIYFPNITKLNLSGNLLENILALTNLSLIEELDISNNLLDNIDILIFTSSKSMMVNASLNYINDFSMLKRNIQCRFTIIGENMQRDINALKLNVGVFYTDVDKDGKQFIMYSVTANQDYPIMLNVQNVALKVINADNSLQKYSSTKPIDRVERVTITMNGQGDTTYIVPAITQQLSEVGQTNIFLGLPEDYIVRPYYNRYSDAVVADGNKITYTTPNDFSGDTIYYEFRKDGQIKGYSRIYLSSNSTGNNVIDDTSILYPNPAESFFVLKNAEGKQVLVHNSLGHKVFDKSDLSNEENIDISSWSPGLYFVVIYDNNRIVSSHKFIKK